MSSHDNHYELCALAASGQLTNTELPYLNQHVQTCPLCANALRDFGQVAQTLFLYANHRRPIKAPTDLTTRFIARANTEGIRLSAIETTPPKWKLNALVCYILIAILVLIGAFLSFKIVKNKLPGLRPSRFAEVLVQNQFSIRPRRIS